MITIGVSLMVDELSMREHRLDPRTEAIWAMSVLYVDEAQDYFDASVEQLLNQARNHKARVIAACPEARRGGP